VPRPKCTTSNFRHSRRPFAIENIIDHSKTHPAHMTALADASYRVTVAVAEFKADVSLRGSMRSLSWEQAFAFERA